MKSKIAAVYVITALSSAPVFAQDVMVKITNLTNALYFTPLLVAAHPDSADVFQVGTPASEHLQAMAEGGDISGLVSDLSAVGASVEENPAAGLLAPGASASASFRYSPRNPRLSVVAMVLPTNDGFVGLDSLRIPRRQGVYHYQLHAFDAGTEVNDEVINGGGMPGVLGIPADPGGNSGTAGTGVVTAEANATVHIHRGIIGDTDPNGGPSDLDSRVHRWLNPVAQVVITVGRTR